MNQLPSLADLIKQGEIWAIVGDHESEHSNYLNSINGKTIEHVSFKHHFKTLSNTTNFYYQQRFNSFDSEDALTVDAYLDSEEIPHAFWHKNKVIELFNLRPLLEEQVIKLSNGETKRLLLATALIKNPSVLLLDHPLTGLDTDSRNTFSNQLQTISDSGIIICMATGPFDLPDSITHVMVMKNGNSFFSGARTSFDATSFDFVHPAPLDEPLLQSLVSNAVSENFDHIIRMNHVTVEYDGRKILDDINWTVRQGDHWSLSGPNGAGKSTLLSLINGDNPQAYANDIVLFDRQRGSGESIWDIKKRTGFVSPELFQYFPTDTTCMHVIESGFYDTIGLFRPTDPAKEVICQNWMKLLNIDQYKNRLFSFVPSDVQRLCLLARALVKNPALLILDEPTQGLDVSQQQFFTNLIDRICRLNNVTLIYVSHYEQHIPPVVDKHLRLREGKAQP